MKFVADVQALHALGEDSGHEFIFVVLAKQISLVDDKLRGVQEFPGKIEQFDFRCELLHFGRYGFYSCPKHDFKSVNHFVGIIALYG